ncbi:MAG: segregation/condensation protein A [Armatimonadetes bacterium]|nr:segregation/condensation protein A [Armatimonadota bacterium]
MELGSFSGPLDLLLHLVQKHEIDIYDIPIARLTDQYLAHLRAMQACDIEMGGEFIVMAATLMEIKSRLLLPPAPRGDGEEEGPDPRAELAQMLDEYRRYKEAAERLRSRAEAWSRVFARGGDLPADVAGLVPEVELANLSVNALVDALQQVLLEAEEEHGVTTVRRERVSVRVKLAALWRRLLASPDGITFRDLFAPPYTRADVVATFLALLELLRLNRVRVRQEHAFGELRIARAPTGSAAVRGSRTAYHG